MTKKNRIIVRLLVVLAALTLISCCFLGTTFARYTSNGSGSASVEVAKWEITMEGAGTDGSLDVTFGKLSPSADPYVAGNTRTNSTGKQLVATITNASAVDAKIEIAAAALKFLDTADAEITDTTVKANAEAVLSVKLYYTTNATPSQVSDYTEITADANSFVLIGTDSTTAAATGVFAKNTPVYVYAEAVWTSKDAADSDAVDTSVGKNVAKVSTTITYTATQDSKLPE